MLNYVSLMSTGFSGSTLVSMLLSSQPRVIGFGDTYFGPQNNPRNPCTCGKAYVECPVRSAITHYARRHGLPDFSYFDMTSVPTPRRLSPAARMRWPLRRAKALPVVRALPGPLRRRLFGRFYAETGLMLEALAETGCYDVYFDGCKNLVRIELLRSADLPLRVLHMVRHPGAYLYHWQRRAGETNLGVRLDGWLRYHMRAARFRDQLGADRYRLVTYESAVGDPSGFLRNVLPFLGLPAATIDEPVKLRPDRLHVMGNSMRLRSTDIIDMSDRWRGQLPTVWESRADALVDEHAWLRSAFSR